MNKDKLINKYQELVTAIEFFSQKFDIEQILDYAVEFVCNLLDINKYVLFINEDGFYKPLKLKNYPQIDYLFAAEEQYENVAMYHAGLFYSKELNKYFPEDLIKYYPAKIAIPLIKDKILLGLLLIDKNDGDFTLEDNIIATALMNLYYTALTNYHSDRKIIEIKRELDEKIFNLFAINQSSKALLSTLNLDEIYTLATSVFSELTQSAITSLFIYDTISESYQMKSLQNVYFFNSSQQMSLYTIKTSKLSLLNYAYFQCELQEDIDALKEHFYNFDDFYQIIRPKFIIPIKGNNKVIGFITLSEKINATNYNMGIFELIDSLASALYIALENASYLKTINSQKNLLDNKLKDLVRLNTLIKNINASSNIESLFSVIKETLKVSFNVNCGLAAMFDKLNNDFIIKETINIDDKINKFRLTDKISELLRGNTITINSLKETQDILECELFNEIQEKCSGALIIPIYLDFIEIELLGVMAVFDIDGKLISNEESILIYESISNHIAPVLYQLQQIVDIKNKYQPNIKNKFIEELTQEIQEAEELCLEIFVFHIHDRSKLKLKENLCMLTLADSFVKSYQIDGQNLLILSYVESDHDIIRTQLDETINLYTYQYNKNFNTINDLSKLLEQQ